MEPAVWSYEVRLEYDVHVFPNKLFARVLLAYHGTCTSHDFVPPPNDK